MSPKKLLEKIRRGMTANIRFSDLTRLAETLGFVLRRTEGSHRIYKHPGLPEKLNLQPQSDGDAKPYQVRQLVRLVEQYSLSLEE